jgi:hypothetical protein
VGHALVGDPVNRALGAAGLLAAAASFHIQGKKKTTTKLERSLQLILKMQENSRIENARSVSSSLTSSQHPSKNQEYYRTTTMTKTHESLLTAVAHATLGGALRALEAARLFAALAPTVGDALSAAAARAGAAPLHVAAPPPTVGFAFARRANGVPAAAFVVAAAPASVEQAAPGVAHGSLGAVGLLAHATAHR